MARRARRAPCMMRQFVQLSSLWESNQDCESSQHHASPVGQLLRVSVEVSLCHGPQDEVGRVAVSCTLWDSWIGASVGCADLPTCWRGRTRKLMCVATWGREGRRQRAEPFPVPLIHTSSLATGSGIVVGDRSTESGQEPIEHTALQWKFWAGLAGVTLLTAASLDCKSLLHDRPDVLSGSPRDEPVLTKPLPACSDQ